MLHVHEHHAMKVPDRSPGPHTYEIIFKSMFVKLDGSQVTAVSPIQADYFEWRDDGVFFWNVTGGTVPPQEVWVGPGDQQPWPVHRLVAAFSGEEILGVVQLDRPGADQPDLPKPDV